MSDLDAQFKTASEEVTQLPEAPDQATMLELYALYKQGTKGECSGKRPSMFDPVGRAKYDAWAKQKGTSQDDAKQAYIDLVEKLKAAAA